MSNRDNKTTALSKRRYISSVSSSLLWLLMLQMLTYTDGASCHSTKHYHFHPVMRDVQHLSWFMLYQFIPQPLTFDNSLNFNVSYLLRRHGLPNVFSNICQLKLLCFSYCDISYTCDALDICGIKQIYWDQHVIANKLQIIKRKK